MLLRAEQERGLRNSSKVGLLDGGLDLDFHGFTRLFHRRGLLADSEYHLCGRVYTFLRETLPMPELFIRLCADEITVASRLSRRDRINIASAVDTTVFNSFLDEWLASLPADRVLELDVSRETVHYEQSVRLILERVFHESTGSL
jgi:deoxyadenosine/deoxycytidine kinase